MFFCWTVFISFLMINGYQIYWNMLFDFNFDWEVKESDICFKNVIFSWRILIYFLENYDARLLPFLTVVCMYYNWTGVVWRSCNVFGISLFLKNQYILSDMSTVMIRRYCSWLEIFNYSHVILQRYLVLWLLILLQINTNNF